MCEKKACLESKLIYWLINNLCTRVANQDLFTHGKFFIDYFEFSRSEIDPPSRSLEESFNGLANFALEQTENSMDLLTLSNIHSEFKSKLFGEEWINREQKNSYDRYNFIGSNIFQTFCNILIKII